MRLHTDCLILYLLVKKFFKQKLNVSLEGNERALLLGIKTGRHGPGY
jgi:hypothetical protein